MKLHTTFKIGGPARYFAEVQNREELQKLWNLSRLEKVPLLVLGAGSNVLIGDGGFQGIVARLTGEFSDIRFVGETVAAGGGAHLTAVINQAASRGLEGLEGLVGVPGTLGGAIVGNAGTREGCVGNGVETVDVLTAGGAVQTIGKNDLKFVYRGSNLGGMIVLSAVLRLKKGQKNDILTKIKNLLAQRLKAQPWNIPSAGSVFKNPATASAWKLIEDSGLRGFRFGGAQVSEKHANFIVNTGDAKAADVRALIALVREKVKEKSGVSLELELKIIGE